MFAPTPQWVPILANSLSALVSSLTILFLFWSITYMARRLVKANGNEYTKTQIILILSSGFVGALAYAFSDTFWFSAVEGEVYATSSLLLHLYSGLF
jgi:cellobiose-specific phosphotransferase system component IIC